MNFKVTMKGLLLQNMAHILPTLPSETLFPSSPELLGKVLEGKTFTPNYSTARN